MTRQDLVSVIIPSYNRAHCIATAVDSVLGQTHRNVEVIVVDDGSKDDTRSVIAARYGDEPRVRYLHQQNQGVSAARNHGLREARGAFIALLDSDDVWLPWKVEAQLRCLAAVPAAGMVWTDMTAVDPEGSVIAQRYLRKMYSAYNWFPAREHLFAHAFPFADLDPTLAAELGQPKVYSGDIYSEMILGNLVHTSTVLLRRERFERVRTFDTSLRRSGEDYDFHLRTCREGPVAYLDAPSILYMWGAADQLTSPKHRIDMARNHVQTIAPVIAADRARIRLPKVMLDEVLAEAHGWFGECLYDLGELPAARRELLTSLRYKPKQPRLAIFAALTLLPLAFSSGLLQGFHRAKSLMRDRAPATGRPHAVRGKP